MPVGLLLSIDLHGDKEASAAFAQSGSTVREAIKGVFRDVGAEVVAKARAGWPASKGASTIKSRIYDGSRGGGTGKIQLLVDNYPRTYRWVQQFEEGTVGTGDEQSPTPARHGPWKRGVRGYNRTQASRHVYQVLGKRRRKMVAQGFAHVRAYERTFKPMPRRPYMGPAFDSVKGTVLPRIEAAVAAALGKVAS